MRLSLKVNGNPRVVAAVEGPGYLSAHANIYHRPKDNDYSKVVRIIGIQTLETETVRFKWPEFHLKEGDIVELHLLSDGESDPPAEVRRSTESPRNLLANQELAKEVLSEVSAFERQLVQILVKSKSLESADEHERFARATGEVLAQLGESLLYPIYRRHKQLVPDEFKGELL
jgi:hypothetical protein